MNTYNIEMEKYEDTVHIASFNHYPCICIGIIILYISANEYDHNNN